MSDLNSVAQFIDRYVNWGLCLIPIVAKDKKPLVKWQQYQHKKPSETELVSWFDGNDRNVGIVCGGISGNLVILDFDNVELYVGFSDFWLEKFGKKTDEMTPIVQTGGGGYHVYIKARVLPRLFHPTGEDRKHIPDIQSEGGYVVAPPSIHPSGNPYRLLNPAVSTIFEVESLPDLAIDIPDGTKPTITNQTEKIYKGSRNNWLTSLAGTMRRRGMAQSAIETALLEENKARCQPPLPGEEVRGIAASMSRYTPNNTGNNNSSLYIMPDNGETDSQRDKSVTDSVTTLAELIERFVTESSGWFSYEDIDREFGISNTKAKDNRRQIIKRLKDSGRIEAHPRNNKLFRFINTNVRLIDFKTAGMRTPLAIRYPFEIEKYFRTYPGNVIAIAGAADSGKTAWLLNFIRQNQEDFSIFYQSSEMGKEELASRLQNFEGIRLEDWNFTAEERSRDFADVIRPDCVNIIDYLELSGDFYNVGEYLREIHDKLAGGICLVALQKKRGADLGRGGDFGLEKPRLYLSMDVGKCTIQKAKNWVDPAFNPNGLVIRYKIVGGCKFIVTESWTRASCES